MKDAITGRNAMKEIALGLIGTELFVSLGTIVEEVKVTNLNQVTLFDREKYNLIRQST